jgi:hypothetical protein
MSDKTQIMIKSGFGAISLDRLIPSNYPPTYSCPPGENDNHKVEATSRRPHSVVLQMVLYPLLEVKVFTP